MPRRENPHNDLPRQMSDKPDAHHFAGMGSPVFESKGEVQVPEDERPEETHEEVVAGIDKIHPALEMSDQT